MDDKTVVETRARIRAGPGTRLNDLYEIDHLIAVGGMGEVYRGHVIETGDPVAIKTIRPDFAENAHALALFRKEAAALFNVHHGAVVRYFVFSIDRQLDLPYLAMEFVTGESLAEAIKRGPLTFASLEILRHRLASGFQAAHEVGIVHRDVSPDNVILPDGDVARAKIIDFGIARTPLAGQTVIGQGFAGKYNYVSPEQFGLQGGDVTAKSDIYSLGLVLAEASLGRPLDMGASPAEFIARRSTVPDLTGIDPRLIPVLEAMLRPDPRMRPDSMADVAAWTTPTVTAREAPPPRPPRSRKQVALGSLAAALVAAAGLTFVALRGPSERAPEPEIDPPLSERPQQTGPRPEAPAPPPRTEQQPVAPTAGDDPASGRGPDIPVMVPSAPPTSPARDPGVQPPARGRADAPPDRQPPVVKDAAVSLSNQAALPSTELPPTELQPAGAPSSPPQTAEGVTAYIRGYQGGPCFWLSPMSVSPREAVIEAYGQAPAPFVAFDSAFKATLGFEANIQLRQIARAQCPVVDLLAQHALTKPSSVPQLKLDSDRLRSGEELRGTIELADDRNLQLLLVDDEGRVHDLGPYLKRTGRQARFAMRLEASAANRPRAQLLVAVASQGPTTTIAAGAHSEAIALAIGPEATRSSGTVGLSVRYVKVGS